MNKEELKSLRKKYEIENYGLGEETKNLIMKEIVKEHKLCVDLVTWEKGDCSNVGLLRLLMIKECNQHVRENGIYADESIIKMLEFCKSWER